MSSPEPTHLQILRLLKEKDGYLSGTLLASQLGLTRTGIWKQIQNLRSIGYEIESHPKEGYRLLATPDLLIPEEIVPHLTTSWLGKPYYYFPQIGSTNDEALHLAAQGAPHGTVAVAEEQTQGRGRLKRPWLSAPRSGIYLSILLRTPLPVREASQSNLVAALALVKTLRKEYDIPAAIKWPNDVLIHGKKTAGILTEMQSDQDYTRFLVVGIGMNVNYKKEQLEASFRYPGTSLAIERGRPIKRQELLLSFLQAFETEHDRFVKRGFESLVPALEQYSAILGKAVKVHTAREEISGKVSGFNSDGALKLLTDAGKEEVIWVGDVMQVEGNY
ncbi:biotin--[acetyl-CoA-carboxylase] ligase [Desulforhabdus amnigena]|uniref:Bifunctional ligase/repressor BirA n=1 Tax=Desulforhabdus amnigena TaxID=40218 RepID=A0A9W6FVD2_9BACT|nr:biotin--[acetyl-CoA-carboxylase] ligase [Desulforhabdus amnigena]GLI35591.1 bifunctional ligase/repressor BirA [Desulforhabdus amnigena]